MNKYAYCKITISIHALRGEGDHSSPAFRTKGNNYFNPRPPWGGRPTAKRGSFLLRRFQSTPSVGRATGATYIINMYANRFQSTPSVGRATSCTAENCDACANISIHALRGEGDNKPFFFFADWENFNPRPPWGGRPRRARAISRALHNFNPRPPWGGRLQKYTNMQCYACT